MKLFLIVIFLAGLAFLLVNRERVYVRDPLATVLIDNQKQSGYQTYINYSNDVLLQHGFGGANILVQNWNKTPANPVVLKCIQWMACMADAEHATTLPLDRTTLGPYAPQTQMTNREVSFIDGEGHRVQISLR